MLHRLGMASLSGPIEALGIPRGQLGFLMYILQNEGIIQESLTRKLYIDRAATARAMRDMERTGLIRRETDPKDRRRKRVFPTRKAKALHVDLLDILNRHNNTLFRGFSEEERTQTLTILDRLVNNLRNTVEETD